MQDFHQLIVWQKAHHLVPRIYKASDDLPKSGNFGLVLNLRRTATSVARFVAEGSGRATDAEFSVDLKRARAALYELEYLCPTLPRSPLLPPPRHDELASEIIEVRKMFRLAQAHHCFCLKRYDRTHGLPV